jgi:hypothetical protein
MSVRIVFLSLSLIVGCSAGNSPETIKVQNLKPIVNVESPTVDSVTLGNLDCSDPNGYEVVEVRDEGNSVNIVKGATIYKTMKLPTGLERNGFGFNWAKKTAEGFEISVDYGSRFYYGKRFNFICRRNEFYLNKITVDSFDKHNPEKWNTKVIKIKPNLNLDKFLITDFMNEGVVQVRE